MNNHTFKHKTVQVNTTLMTTLPQSRTVTPSARPKLSATSGSRAHIGTAEPPIILFCNIWGNAVSRLTMPRKPTPAAKQRVRTGCLTCRKRRRKCDEQKPSCANCEAKGLPCKYSSDLAVVPQREGAISGVSRQAYNNIRVSTPQRIEFFSLLDDVIWK